MVSFKKKQPKPTISRYLITVLEVVAFEYKANPTLSMDEVLLRIAQKLEKVETYNV